MNEETERVKYIMHYWSKLQLARDFEELEKENQKLVKAINEINECMKKYKRTSVDDAKTIIEFYKQLENILNKITELKGGNNE